MMAMDIPQSGPGAISSRRYAYTLLKRTQEYVVEYTDAFPKEGEVAKDTLFHEFGKVVSKLAGAEYDVRLNLAAVMSVTKAPIDIDIPGFLTRVTLGNRGSLKRKQE